jgi:xanthine dehydrogenase accessory factor
MRRAQLEQLQAAIEARRPVVALTTLATGVQHLVHPGDPLPDDLNAAVAEAVRTDRSGVVKTAAGEEVFINVFNPALRMVIIGAVHISQALIPMAKAAGYDCRVIDPRTAFASGERFAGVKLDARWPDEALPDLALDRRTAFVALTHDPKIDDPALTIALTSDCFYVGALGSSRTHAKRRERLAAAGCSQTTLERIRAPIGLDIGAIGAPEIAISIMAEVTALLRGKGGARA